VSTPARHPASGRFTPAAGLPSADAVNQELQNRPDAPDDASKNTGGGDAGYPS